VGPKQEQSAQLHHAWSLVTLVIRLMPVATEVGMLQQMVADQLIVLVQLAQTTATAQKEVRPRL